MTFEEAFKSIIAARISLGLENEFKYDEDEQSNESFNLEEAFLDLIGIEDGSSMERFADYTADVYTQEIQRLIETGKINLERLQQVVAGACASGIAVGAVYAQGNMDVNKELFKFLGKQYE